FFRLNSFCDGNRSLLIPFPFKGMLWKSFLRFERRTRCGFFRKTGFMLQELESPEHKKSNKNEDDICHKGNEEKQNRAEGYTRGVRSSVGHDPEKTCRGKASSQYSGSYEYAHQYTVDVVFLP